MSLITIAKLCPSSVSLSLTLSAISRCARNYSDETSGSRESFQTRYGSSQTELHLLACTLVFLLFPFPPSPSSFVAGIFANSHPSTSSRRGGARDNLPPLRRSPPRSTQAKNPHNRGKRTSFFINKKPLQNNVM